MEWLKKYWMQITGLVTVITPLLTWAGSSILEGQYQKGYNEAKHQNDEEYNDALRDAIVYRAKYESCCTAED